MSMLSDHSLQLDYGGNIYDYPGVLRRNIRRQTISFGFEGTKTRSCIKEDIVKCLFEIYEEMMLVLLKRIQ